MKLFKVRFSSDKIHHHIVQISFVFSFKNKKSKFSVFSVTIAQFSVRQSLFPADTLRTGGSKCEKLTGFGLLAGSASGTLEVGAEFVWLLVYLEMILSQLWGSLPRSVDA